jgi:hypothetical protein
MAKRADQLSLEDHQRRASAQFVVIKDWLLGPDPDPTYDRTNGWKLDQFAMAFFPDLVRQYKRARAEEHPSAGPRDGFASRNPMGTLELGHKLSAEIMRRLLDGQFRVEGYQLQSYAPMAIPIALLEHMHPIVETSEFRELYVPGEIARRFEKVRVFEDLEASTKSKGGRKPTFNWPLLAERLEKQKPVLATDAELVAYCRKNVTVNQGKRASKDGPDNKTITAAIYKYELKKFIMPA